MFARWEPTPGAHTVRRVAPRKRTPAEKAEVGAFVDKLLRMSGYDTITEFASRAGLYGSNVGEYINGGAMPDGYTLIKLMDSAGVRLTARDGAVDLPELAAPRVLRAEQQEVVDEVLRQIREQVLPDLADVRTRVERLEAEPTQKTRTRAGG